MRWNLLFTILLLLAMTGTGSFASDDCDPSDGNNAEVDAIAIGANETVTGVVCPDDPFDFYTIVIPESAIVTGRVSFSSPQDATVLRVYNKTKSTILIDDLSTTTKNSYNITFDAGTITPGTYYCRIYHWSDADYDHEYTLTMDLQISVPRSSGTGGFGSTEFPAILNVPTLTTVQTIPWPGENGNADQARCSKYAGPGGKLVERYSADLFDSVLSWEKYHPPPVLFADGYTSLETIKPDQRRAGFHNLLAGAGDRLYFTIKPEDGDHTTFAYDTGSGQRWESDDIRGGFLGRGGRIYSVINFPAGSAVIGVDINGKEKFRELIPNGAPKSVVGGVGRGIYVDCGWEGSAWSTEGENYVSSFAGSGQIKWTSDPITKKIHSMAEDSGGNLYVRDIEEFLHKIGPDGEMIWSVEMPSHEYSKNDTYYMRGPITGADGKVWLCTQLFNPDAGKPQYVPGATPGSSTKITPPRSNGPVYVVMNPDGTAHKYDFFGGEEKFPRFVCYGSNETLCVSFSDDTISGFTDWDQLSWSWQSPGMDQIVDMVMDKNGFLYVLHHGWGIQSLGLASYIVVIDTSTGAQLSQSRVEIPEGWAGATGELAIGDNGRLIYLNRAGYLKVYGPALRMQSSGLKEMIRIQ